MPTDRIAEPWRSFLKDLDAICTADVNLHCMGGFVLTQMYGLARPTADLDSLSINPTNVRADLIAKGEKGSELHKKHGVYLDLVTIAAVPENYEERLSPMFEGAFKHLRLYALDPYDLALSKLERNIQRDRDDVKHLAKTIPFDLKLLEDRYRKELRPLLGNPEREDLTLRLWLDAIQEERDAP
jgi:hypothetical protein